MADPNVPTATASECFDPEIHPAPRGATLWVVNPGGAGHKGHWYEGAIAWAYLPKLPASVKARMDAIAKQKQQSELHHGNQSTELQEKQTG